VGTRAELVLESADLEGLDLEVEARLSDHVTGRLVWAAEGRSKKVVERFFEQLGPQQASLVVVTLIEPRAESASDSYPMSESPE
jgi:transposase